MHTGDEVLTNSEKKRYSRQLMLSNWGMEGQKRIKEAVVFIAGAGGLGSSAAFYLASAGIGCLRICDSGEVKLSNLNRQILYTDADIGKQKVWSARETLSRVNPHVHIVSLFERIERSNVAELVSDSRIIIDCLDNFGTRHVINEYAAKKSIPFIHAGIYGMSGQITFIHSPETPCLKCIFPASVPSSSTVFPVVGTAAGVMGCLEALEALKYLTGEGTLLKKRLLVWEGDTANFEEIVLEKNPLCPVCGNKM